jgi:outer membrane protein assembly factor BamB
VERPEGVATSHGLVFVSSDDGQLRAFDTSCRDVDCAPIWTAKTTPGLVSAPVEADGRIFTLSSDGTLRVFSIRTGASSNEPVRKSSPALFYLALLAVVLVSAGVVGVRRRHGHRD